MRQESDAPTASSALCQTEEAEFPALALGDVAYTDVVLSTSFKPISGEEDPGRRAYLPRPGRRQLLIVRANALEDNVAICKYHDDRRSDIVSESV